MKGVENTECGIPRDCSRAIPVWLVLLDNVPTVVMYGLGTALIRPTGMAWAVAYVAYSCFSIVFFWMRICTHCHHYGTLACPCGYGAISARLFASKRDQGREFRSVFRNNILVVFPSWFVPLGVGGYLLWSQFTAARLCLFSAFCLVGFVLIPLISKLAGCRNCSIKDECPWMKPRPPATEGRNS